MSRILEDDHRQLLRDERRALMETLGTLADAGAGREERSTLEQSIAQLEHLFLMVVVGEFNSGKSSLINALVGSRVLPEGVTPTTQRIHRLQYGESATQSIGPGGVETIAAPIELLDDLVIVDTPGTNALDREHEAITSDFVPRADLVLFVTSADRPFTESERQFMEAVRSWGKKLLLVINKVDILAAPTDAEEVRRFVDDNALRILGHTPPIFSVSARDALAARLQGEEPPAESGFPKLETYLYETLDDAERLRLKLSNPLGVARRLLEASHSATSSRLDLLASDSKALADVEDQLEHYREDMRREFRFRLGDVDRILLHLERRGVDFFDETLRLPRALDLLNKAKIQADFERQVIGDVPRQIDDKVQEIIDWMVAAELRQWQSISTTLEKRRQVHEDRIVGTAGSFDTDRRQLLETVGRAAGRTVDAFDQRSEAERMAESVRTAVAGAALIEVGAVSLGTMVSLLATTQLADFTGLLAAGTMAVLGLMVLPARKRRAKRELVDRIQKLRQELVRALTEQFDHELERSLIRIADAISPYTRFVRSERSRLEESLERLAARRRELEGLEARIDAL